MYNHNRRRSTEYAREYVAELVLPGDNDPPPPPEPFAFPTLPFANRGPEEEIERFDREAWYEDRHRFDPVPRRTAPAPLPSPPLSAVSGDSGRRAWADLERRASTPLEDNELDMESRYHLEATPRKRR